MRGYVIFEMIFISSTSQKSVQFFHVTSVEQIERFLKVFGVFQITGNILIQAMKAVKTHQLQFWDSLIWCIAHENQIPIIFTEDFSEDEIIEGVRIVNPFSSQFSLNDWRRELSSKSDIP